jgi:hypothetical protein
VAGGMREGACAGHMFAMSCSILPLPLARDRRRSRILDLQPAVGARGPVRRSQLLRYDALTAKRAGVLVDDRAVAGVVRIEGTRPRRARKPWWGRFARLQQLR